MSGSNPSNWLERIRDQCREVFGSARFRHPRGFRGPVGWMLDRQLLTSLREIVFYDAIGSKADARNWMTGNELDFSDDVRDGEFWFDYLSDTGDGMNATYSVAYLAQADWFVAGAPHAGADLEAVAPTEQAATLPRGSFLFVGGDTCYHVADLETLTVRFCRPFNEAFRDLKDTGRLSAPMQRPIVAIPGNHDYYDFLDGFNRQFRKPYNPEQPVNQPQQRKKGPDAPNLQLCGFVRVQSASFLSIRLPFQWRMWGMDTKTGRLDRRQQEFFRLTGEPQPPEKNEPMTYKPPSRLIVATPEPIVAFGKPPSPTSEYAKTFMALDLTIPSLDRTERAGELPPGQCRLDLAGDVHHYARYGGAPPGADSPACHASVVSGLGGAFLHATSTDVGEVPAEAHYPSPALALRKTLTRLLTPWTILAGGRLWMLGLLVTTLTYIGIATSPSIGSFVEPLLKTVGVARPALQDCGEEGASCDPATKALWLLSESLPDSTGSERVALHPESAFLLVLLPLLFWGRSSYQRQLRKIRDGVPISDRKARSPVWLLLAAALATVVWVYGNPEDGYGKNHAMMSALILMLTLLAAYLAFRWSRLYDEIMNRKALTDTPPGTADHLHGGALWLITLLLPIFGIARYGVESLALMSIDMGFLLMTGGGLLGLTLFAAFTGGHLLGGVGKLGMGFLGLWHGLVQLLLPQLILLALPWCMGIWVLAGIAGLSLIVAIVSGLFLADANAGGRRIVGAVLLMLWMVAVVLIVWLALHSPSVQPANFYSLFTASALGALLSCIWLGWYLAVSICFDAHNNEAGGGARIEKYKQLIRFRLTRDALTGFVIAVDQVECDGTKLKPRLVDVFELRPPTASL